MSISNIPGVLFLLLLLLVSFIGQLAKFGFCQETNELRRDDFPSDFVFGAGTSAYQVEGAVAEDGRKPSVWDIFTHEGKVIDKSTGDIASDGYHKYKEDVKLMSDLGLEAYRFSISWSRVLPDGRGAINPKGVEYYNNLINELISHGIQPHITLYHLDLPQTLEDEYGGWLNPKIIEDFTKYAEVCFKEFGDRVGHWTTLNEPNIMAIASYNSGFFPPQRCSYPGGLIFNCTVGNSSIEPYIAMHHYMLSHASAARLYKEKYQAKQNGLLGLNLNFLWAPPKTNSTSDMIASKRAIDFYIGWAMDPLIHGDYPESMKTRVGSRIPSFTESESELIKGSADFIGINHYNTIYIQDNPSNATDGLADYYADMNVKMSVTKDGTPGGQFDPTGYMRSNPSGLQMLLQYFKEYYGNPPVYIHENGYSAPKNEELNDTVRIDYMSGFIGSTLKAIRNGTNTRGYFVWSFVDVFEVLFGYTVRYGLVHVDFEDKELKRQPKSSARWYSNFLKNKKHDLVDMKIKKVPSLGKKYSSQ
ncbi:hypothetical protein MKW92_050741 [Papaver armeniacum]|nr:hypothetical protein MKW92_050741 [Papaver armeniacum]